MFVSAKEAANEKDNAVSDLKEGANRVKRDVHETANKMKDDLHSASAMARHAGSQVRDFVDDASHRISRTTDKVATEVRHNPMTAAAVALGLGVFLGALFSSRR